MLKFILKKEYRGIAAGTPITTSAALGEYLIAEGIADAIGPKKKLKNSEDAKDELSTITDKGKEK